MNAAVVEQHPYNDGRDEIINQTFFSQFLHECHKHNDHNGNGQQRQVNTAAVEDGYHQDGNEVVGNGQGRKEHLERNRHLISQNGENTYCESNICGRRNTPTGGGQSAVVYQGVNESGHDHAAEGCNYGQDGLLEGRKFSAHHLTFDFQTHREEENHHENVVDELLHGHIPGEEPVYQTVGRGHVDGEFRMQETVIKVFGKGKVGQQHGQGHADQQNNPVGPGLLSEAVL